MSQGDHDRGTEAATTLQERPEAPRTDADIEARDAAEIASVLGGDVATDPDRGTTTRDLLAEVASRAPHEPRPATLERSERRFVRWLLVTLLLACVTLLAVLWWLDPISVTGRQTRFSVVENGGVRQAKLDLMEELPAAPDVLVLGSSRSMKLDPKEIERVSGATAFNGAVSGGTSQDMYLYARYADQLWGGGAGQPDEFPHLVIGVVNDVLRFTGTAALDPRLRRYLPKAEQERDPLEVAKQLLQLKTVEAAARATRRVVPRDGVGALLDPTGGKTEVDASLTTTGKQKGNQRENLDARGMQLFDPGADYSKPLAQRVESQMTNFVARSFEADPNYTGVDPRGLDLLRRTIKLANSHGDVPTLWVTPYQPDALAFLPEAYQDRDRAFRAAIKELQQDDELRFEFVDLDDLDSFDGDPAEFHDGIHMTVKNTARVIARLQADDLLAPKG